MRTVGRGTGTPGEVLVVSGPPAAGKSTAAALLSARCTDPSVHLRGDHFFQFLSVGRKRGWMSGAGPQNEVVTEAMAKAVASYASGGYVVLLDTVLAPRRLPIVREVLGALPVHYVILRPSFVSLLERSHGRDVKDRHDDTVLSRLYAHFTDLGPLERHLLDTTDLDPETTVATVGSLWGTGQLRLT